MPDHTAVWKVQYHLILLVLVDNLETITDKDDCCHLSIQPQKVCLIDNLQVASMPGHSIKQRAQRKLQSKWHRSPREISELRQF